MVTFEPRPQATQRTASCAYGRGPRARERRASPGTAERVAPRSAHFPFGFSSAFFSAFSGFFFAASAALGGTFGSGALPAAGVLGGVTAAVGVGSTALPSSSAM